MPRRAVWCLSLAACLCLPGALRAAGPPRGPLEGLDGYVEEVMREWHVPGLALGVVRDGKVLLARGYGLRDVEKKLPVTPRTLFAIGSISKSFTSLAIAQLVDAGKIDLDRTVASYLPAFKLSSAAATRTLTVRELLAREAAAAAGKEPAATPAAPPRPAKHAIRTVGPVAKLEKQT